MPSRTRSAPLWDPQTILKIDNMGRCAGWASTRGRNCANVIALHNQQNAESLMKAMSTKEPDADDLENDLYRLAGFLLCRRWHQNQADDMVEKWGASMERFAAVQDEIETTRRRRSSAGRTSSIASDTSSYSGTSSRSTRSSTNSRTSSSRSSPRASSPASPSSSRSQLREMQSLRSQDQERIAQLEMTLSVLTAQITALAQAAPATRAGLPIQAASSNQTADATQLVLEASVPAPSEPTSPRRRASSRPSPTPIAAPSCNITHVRRRAIDDDCPICYSDFLQHDELVWCKSECGRTVHKTCFDKWEKMCQNQRKAVTCSICRTPWERECAC